MLNITSVVVGPIQTNCWILSDTELQLAMVVDPGDSPERILGALGDLKVEKVVLTHRHGDHRGALAQVCDTTGAQVMAHEADAHGVFEPIEDRLASPACVAAMRSAADEGRSVDVELKEGDKVALGSYEFAVIHTPGHTEGCMCLYCEAEKVMITGDTLFAGGSYGRTDLEGGDWRQMLSTLDRKFAQIPDDVRLLCGHGPASTMGSERRRNPYLR